MKVSECFKTRPVISFEIFPPRPNAKQPAIDKFYESLDTLASLKPAYISITYGAGGGTSSEEKTIALAKFIKEHYGIEPVIHLPAVAFNKETMTEFLDKLAAAHVENVLALRGDKPKVDNGNHDFTYATDLVDVIKARGDYYILGACHPDIHPESANAVEDTKHLKEKVDAGVSQLVSQLFFDNQHFYNFIERCELAGIDVPIQAGIMPVINQRQIEKMATMGGVELPPKFLKIMDRYKDNPGAMRDAGIAYAVDQIVDLLAEGVDGIHLYTMDNPVVTKRICEAIRAMV